MLLMHKLILYTGLGILGVSLLFPGLVGIFKSDIGAAWLVAENIDARNHLRALNAMMAALGVLALWACYDLETSRSIVVALGVIMAFLVIARVYSIVIDGMPGLMTNIYLAVETLLAALFLAWPPPPAG